MLDRRSVRRGEPRTREIPILSAILLVISSFAAAGTGVATGDTPGGKLELTVSTAPVPNSSTYTLTATLRNVTTDTVIAAPRVTFKPGEAAHATSGAGEWSARFSISSDAKKSDATVDLEYSVKGEVVFAPRIVVRL